MILNRKFTYLLGLFLLFSIVLGYKYRETIKRFYYINCYSGDKIVPEFLFAFIPPTANPNVSQQSVACDEENIYVVYPADKGTLRGVVQVYDWKGNLKKEFNDVYTGHGSSSVYLNDSLYILADKMYDTVQQVVVMDVKSGDTLVKSFKMPYKMLWDGLGVCENNLYFIGLNGTNYTYKKGISPKNQPDSLAICVFGENGIMCNSIEKWMPKFHYENCNGVAVSVDTIMMLCNSFGEKKRTWKPSYLFITPPKKNCPYLTNNQHNKEVDIPKYITKEAEGGLYYNGEWYVSIHGIGLYKLHLKWAK